MHPNIPNVQPSNPDLEFGYSEFYPEQLIQIRRSGFDDKWLWNCSTRRWEYYVSTKCEQTARNWQDVIDWYQKTSA